MCVLPPQQRLVLAVLAARRGEPCRASLLEEAIWGDDPPERARRLLQGLVSRLRRRLTDHGGRECLVGVPDGWQLELAPAEIDAAWFECLATDARRRVLAGELDAARTALEDALELWCGPPFGEFADHPQLAGECTRLRERHLSTREQLLELRLRVGEPAEVLHEVGGLVEEYPLRERLHELHLRALYRAGRPAEALTAYQRPRDRLGDELGVEPGPRLQELHTAILRHDLSPDEPVRAPAVAPHPPATTAGWPCRRELPMTGRNQELAELEAALAEASAGRRRAVLVVGEPGIGKTRLVAELADRARSTRVLVGRCSDGAGIPYQPFVEALRMDLALAGDAGLAPELGPHIGPLARLVPEVQADRREQTPVSSNPRLDRHHLFTAVDAWLRRAEQPLLLVLEDLQWATPETLLLLRHLLRQDPSTPLAIVLTARDDAEEQAPELVETLADLVVHPDASELRLAPLPPQDVGHLVAAQARGAAFPSRLAGEAYDASGGNPLFVQELLAGIPGEADELPRSSDGSLRIPRSLRLLLDARVQRLSDVAVHLLEQAAIVGAEIDFDLVADAAGLDPTEALDGLDEAIGARLLAADGQGPDRYAFGHAVIRQALLVRQSPSRRARRHARYAAALERARPDPTPILAGLAHHVVHAGSTVDSDRTPAVLRAAGDAAMAQLAHAEAAEHYRRALGFVGPDDDGKRCDLLTALGDAQQHAGPGDHSVTLLEALRLATELGDADRIVTAAWANNRGYPSHLFSVDEERAAALERALGAVDPGAVGARATLLALLGGELTFAEGDRTGRARQLSDRALGLATRAGPVVLARVLMLRQFTIQGPDTVAERLANTAELIPLADELNDPTLQVFSRQWRAVAAMQAADRPEADRRIDEVLARAAELGEPFMQCTAHMLAASRELAWGDLDAVTELASYAEAFGLEADAIDIQGVRTFQEFWCHRENGNVEQALPRIEEFSGRYGEFPHWQSLQALAWWELGRLNEALGVLDRYGDEGFDVVSDVAGLHALCCFAELAADGRHHRAAKQLVAVLEPYADQLAASQAMCTGPVAYFLGRLAVTLGWWDEATVWLDRAERISEQVGAVRWLRRVRVAQAQLAPAENAPALRAREPHRDPQPR